MEFEITTEAAGKSQVVHVVGDVDIYTAPRLRSALAEAIDAAEERIVLDLSRVHFIDSTGLSVLAGSLEKATPQGRAFRIVLDDPYLMKMFRITGFDGLFSIYPTVATALAPAV